jgi:pyruvate-formate lyase-activating enzyme
MTNFPIQTNTGCRLKWAWSTIFLSKSTTSSCHRVDHDNLTLDTFENFHNLPRKLNDRRLMKEGKWPGGGCEYCKNIESANGYSDRQAHLQDQFDNLTPVELLEDPTAIKVTPRILEVYFNNTCNFKCVYCGPWFSTKIAAELKIHGTLNGVTWKDEFDSWKINPNYNQMVDKFWAWFKEHRHKIDTFQILGGEPLLQQEFEDCLTFFNENPSPNLNLVIITNLSATDQKMDYFIDRFKQLLGKRKLKAIQITASLDCWGIQSEYIRNGLDLAQWERNFEKLLANKWINLQVNHAINVLSIKYMPELLIKLKHWNNIRNIYSNFMTVQIPRFFNPDIFGKELFDDDFNIIDSLMLEDSEFNLNIKKYMQGIHSQISNSSPNIKEINNLKNYLENIDKRRGTDYTVLFPWLAEEFRKYV